jgi:hypothetical protein
MCCKAGWREGSRGISRKINVARQVGGRGREVYECHEVYQLSSSALMVMIEGRRVPFDGSDLHAPPFKRTYLSK